MREALAKAGATPEQQLEAKEHVVLKLRALDGGNSPGRPGGMPADPLLAGAADLLAADLQAAPERAWRARARPKQLPPGGDWNIWLIMAGRGWGKNFVGCNWLAEKALAQPGTVWAVIAPTFRDARVTCFEGPTGLLAAFNDDEIAPNGYRRNELQLTLVNGSRIYGYQRRPARAAAWCEPRRGMGRRARLLAVHRNVGGGPHARTAGRGAPADLRDDHTPADTADP